MKTTRKFWILAALTATATLAMPMHALAQDDPAAPPAQGTPGQGGQDVESTVVASIELDQADIRDALRTLFKNVGVTFQVAQDVQGSITLTQKNVPFRTALEAILKQADATYRIDAGVYNIIKKPTDDTVIGLNQDQTTTPTTSNKVLRRIHIQHADPLMIYYMLTGLNMRTAALMEPEISARNKGNGNNNGGGFGNSGNNGNSGGGFGNSGNSGFGSSGSSGGGGSFGGGGGRGGF